MAIWANSIVSQKRLRGFIWRIDEDQWAQKLSELGHGELTSATVSVWRSVEDFRSDAFETTHGDFLDRTREWFEKADGPHLVIWPVTPDAKPGFTEATDRLEYLKENGLSDNARGWN